MPTDIYFGGNAVFVTVEEDPGQVAEAFASAHGLPFRLTRRDGQGDVYVNPATVAFWSAPDSSAPAEPAQESAAPRPTRETVTDIWGQPIRRKPRR